MSANSGEDHTIAHWLTELGAEGLYDRMIQVTKDYHDEGDLIVPDPKIKLITETLRELYEENGGKGEVTLASKEICNRLTLLARENDLIEEEDKHYLSPKSLGWKLKHMRLKKPDKRNRKVREWVIDEVILQRLERPFNLTNQTSQTSLNVTTSQNSDVSPENDVCDVKDVLPERVNTTTESNVMDQNSDTEGDTHETLQEVDL